MDRPIPLYTLETSLTEAEDTSLTDQFIAYNRAHGPARPPRPEEPRPVQVALRVPDGRLIGGLIGRTHTLAFWLEISVLWVDAAYRQQGLGRRLMDAAEQEARQRGCRFARTATSDFQAPGFYAKLGYVQYGLLEDCPPGEAVYYYRKVL